MPYQLLDSTDVVQVFSPTLVSDALLCTILSSPSGSVLIRTVPSVEFKADRGAGILASLSDAVEGVLGEGLAVAAQGVQGIDEAGTLYDAIVYTVRYVPSYETPGEITGSVEVPVNVQTADTQFGSFLTGGSAAERILEEYNRLKTLAGE